jgi:hypothetical protein
MSKKITINNIYESSAFEIVPTKVKRDWMDNSHDKFAYHCVPLNVANTYGWSVLSPESFSVTWNGGSQTDSIKVNGGSGSQWVSSHFGGGVFTIGVDFVVRTEDGISLYVRGMPNEPHRGIYPLDGIIETDWLPFTFTFNYIFTEPCTVKFEKDEPLFSFFPIERSFIKEFELKRANIKEDKEFFKKFTEYSKSRKEHIDEKKPERQRYYLKGTGADGIDIDILDHTKKYSLNGEK